MIDKKLAIGDDLSAVCEAILIASPHNWGYCFTVSMCCGESPYIYPISVRQLQIV